MTSLLFSIVALIFAAIGLGTSSYAILIGKDNLKGKCNFLSISVIFWALATMTFLIEKLLGLLAQLGTIR